VKTKTSGANTFLIVTPEGQSPKQQKYHMKKTCKDFAETSNDDNTRIYRKSLIVQAISIELPEESLI
jgi:hypothetical protein